MIFRFYLKVSSFNPFLHAFTSATNSIDASSERFKPRVREQSDWDRRLTVDCIIGMLEMAGTPRAFFSSEPGEKAAGRCWQERVEVAMLPLSARGGGSLDQSRDDEALCSRRLRGLRSRRTVGMRGGSTNSPSSDSSTSSAARWSARSSESSNITEASKSVGSGVVTSCSTLRARFLVWRFAADGVASGGGAGVRLVSPARVEAARARRVGVGSTFGAEVCGRCDLLRADASAKPTVDRRQCSSGLKEGSRSSSARVRAATVRAAEKASAVAASSTSPKGTTSLDGTSMVARKWYTPLGREARGMSTA